MMGMCITEREKKVECREGTTAWEMENEKEDG